jgi:hypothetical protein
MAQDSHELLDFLKFELKFLEDGGYGRSPHAPRRESQIFQDSPSCLNFGDPDKPHPCSECWVMDFVPEAYKNRNAPCRFIPLTEKGETLDDFYRGGKQLQMEEALANWLRAEINRIEQEQQCRERAEQGPSARS